MSEHCRKKPWHHSPHACHLDKGHSGPHKSSILHGEFWEDKHGEVIPERCRQRWITVEWSLDADGKMDMCKNSQTEWE